MCDISSKEKCMTSSPPSNITGKAFHSPLSSIRGERTRGVFVYANCALPAKGSKASNIIYTNLTKSTLFYAKIIINKELFSTFT